MDQPDRENWRSYRRGDGNSLGLIYNRHKDRLYSYSLYVTGNRQLSEDIVQETFTRLMEQSQKLDDDASIKDWLFICVRNLAFNHLKKRKRGSLIEAISDHTADIDVETRLFIQNVLDKLTPPDRELILLREQQRFNTRDIARMLGLTEEAVRVRLFRVRKKMQQIAKGKL